MTDPSFDREPRRFRLHWWGWVILGVLLVVSLGLALHVQGTNRLESVQREIAARGWPIDPVTLVATLPPVDEDRQNRLWATLQRINTWSDPPRGWSSHELQAVTLTDAEQSEIDRFIRAGVADMANLRAILDEGPVDISTGGWIERDQTRLSAMRVEDFWQTRTPNLLSTRSAMIWLALRARHDEAEVSAALDVMQAFAVALDRPTTLIDAMVAVAICDIRDMELLRQTMRGNPDGATVAAWAAEPAPHQRWFAQALRGDRCLYEVPLVSYDGFMYMGFRQYDRADPVPYPLQRLECAMLISAYANLEARLRDAAPFPIVRTPVGVPTLYAGSNIDNVRWSTDHAYTGSYRHRLRRLAGQLAHDHRHGRALPDDQAAAIQRPGAEPWQPRSANEPAIAYERLSPTRFRIGLAPRHPHPALHGHPIVPVGTRPPTSLGSAASAKAWDQHDWSLEIDLDAILVPPSPRGKRP